MRRTWIGFVLLASVGFAAPARAAPPTAHLVLERPIESFCPSADALQRDVEELAGREVFAGPDEADLEVHCVITDGESGVHATVDVRAADGHVAGTRELAAPPGECASLRGPLALILVMLLDREAPLDPEVEATADDPTPGAPPQRSFGAGLGLLSGTLPRVTAGLGLSFERRFGSAVGLRVQTAYWFPVPVELDPEEGVRFQALSGALALCPTLFGRDAQARGRLVLCAGAQGVALFARPHGFERNTRGFAVMAQAGLVPEVSWRLPRLRLAAGLGVAIALNRPEFFVLQDDGSRLIVHQPARVGVISYLEIRIPGL